MARATADRRAPGPILSLANPKPPRRLQASGSRVSKTGLKESTRRWSPCLHFLSLRSQREWVSAGLLWGHREGPEVGKSGSQRGQL